MRGQGGKRRGILCGWAPTMCQHWDKMMISKWHLSQEVSSLVEYSDLKQTVTLINI